MRHLMVCAALAAGLAGVAHAEVQMHGPADTAKAVLAADRAFAVVSDKEGSAKAFRAFMDPVDGLMFAGGEPTRGLDAIYKAQGGDAPAKAKLAWTPDEVFASTGDMGVTWGHWTLTPIGAAKPLIKGRYVTVWRRDAKGEWKGLIDIGDHD